GGQAGHAGEWAALAARCEASGDPLAAARARLGQLVQLAIQGFAGEALALAEQIRPVIETIGSAGDQAWLLRAAGMAFAQQGESAQDMHCFTEAAAHFQALGQRGELAKTWFEHSRSHERRGDLAQAIRYVQDAYQVVESLDLPLRIAFCKKNLGC